jgi:hypothetical protein
VLLAMVILSIISLTVWATFTNSFRIRDQLDRVDSQTHRIRTLFAKLGRDISMLYLVKEKKFNTLVVGKDDGLADSLTFTTFSNRVYAEDKNEADQVIITYYVETNQDDPSLVDIYRWSLPYVEDDQYWGERKGVLLMPAVRQFDFTYYDGSQFKKSWDTSVADFAGKVPQAVKLDLELANGDKISDLFLPALTKVIGGKAIKAAAKPSATASASATPTATGSPTPGQGGGNSDGLNNPPGDGPSGGGESGLDQ